jgi:cytochrome c-type biogenesis protein CcmH/NrfF
MRTKALHWLPLLFLGAAAAYDDRGALNPDVTQDTIAQTICLPGYTKSVRPAAGYASDVKRILMERAGMNPGSAQYYELDYVIPLALGGHPTDRRNFALQILEGKNGAKRKDRIEAKLQCMVCSGQVTIADAQREILTDWQAAYQRHAQAKCWMTNRLRKGSDRSDNG